VRIRKTNNYGITAWLAVADGKNHLPPSATTPATAHDPRQPRSAPTIITLNHQGGKWIIKIYQT